ncbi:prostatic acid phosphatase-like [Argopecten irradians]|uniref:prostatic acid phosphatase-like n=1 Tax=Argopecten irradians TaxID=31199 RepID=UPI003713A934
MTETIHFLVWLLLLFVLLIKDVEGDNLVLVQAVFRHGDRSPTHSFPNDRYAHYWPQGLGQLTKVGKQQEYRLGNFYKEKYIDTAFLGPNYNHSEIHIRSTDVDRTLMSAYCVLSGMFPPGNGSDQQWNPKINWQPIPVHTVPINEDFLLNTNAPCPTFNKLREALLKSKVIENFTLQHQDLIKTVSEIAGLPTSIKSLFTVADAVFCENYLFDIYPQLLNTNAPCPTFNKLREALLKSKVIENFTLQHQDLIKTVSEIAGLPTSIKSLFTVADAVFCEYKQNLNMSEWEEVLPLNVVIQLLDNLNVFNFYTEEMARLRGGQFFTF